MARSLFQDAVRMQAEGDLNGAAKLYRKLQRDLPWLLGQGGPVSGPDFLVIGAPRAGTTWIRRSLSTHPGIRISHGEPHYFSLKPYDSPVDYVRTITERLIGGPPPEGQRMVIGEKSPSYLVMNATKVTLCAALFPKAQIICTVREPVARAISHLRHQKILSEERIGCKGYRDVVFFGRYANHLQRWAAAFGPDRIHLTSQAEIAADPRGAFDGIVRRLGLDPRAVRDLPGPIGRTSGEAPRAVREALEREYQDEVHDVDALRALIGA